MLDLFDQAFLARAPRPAFLLDAFPGATAAYSLRQLRTGVTNVVRVRRSSDNTEADFTAAQVDDGSLAAWVGAGNNGFVKTWYDQSENNRHAIQTASANQPQIVGSGSLFLTNNKPALNYNGTSQRLVVPTIAFNMNALSVNIVSKANGPSTQMAFSSPEDNRVYVPFLGSNVYCVGYGASATAFNFGSSNLSSQYLTQLNAGSANANAWRNNSASTAITASSAGESGTGIMVGCYSNASRTIFTSFWNGTIQEVVFYRLNQTANQPGIASNINAHYAIY